jgi:REP element-mobilizing transposase RayT
MHTAKFAGDFVAHSFHKISSSLNCIAEILVNFMLCIMTHGCKIDKQDAAYFCTFTIVDWENVFAEERFKNILVNDLNFCVEKKGLEIFSYVLMNTHMHLLARSKNDDLSFVLGGFKKFSAIKILNILRQEDPKSIWLKKFSEAAKSHSRNEKFQFWKYGNHPEEVYSPKFTLSKIKYIHNNPVEAGLVNRPEDYYYSSAVDYAGRTSPVKVSLLSLHNLYY